MFHPIKVMYCQSSKQAWIQLEDSSKLFVWNFCCFLLWVAANIFLYNSCTLLLQNVWPRCVHSKESEVRVSRIIIAGSEHVLSLQEVFLLQMLLKKDVYFQQKVHFAIFLKLKIYCYNVVLSILQYNNTNQINTCN